MQSGRGRRTVEVVCVLASVAVFGCSADDEADTSLENGCDIVATGCQQAVFDATARIREQQGASMPDIRTISRSQLADEIRGDAEADSDSDVWTAAFRLVDLLPEESSTDDAVIDAVVAHALAYYDDEAKGVTIIDDGSGDPLDGVFVLAHEFVHALQDAAVDLNAFEDEWATSTDSFVAVRTLMEGEANVLAAGVLAEALGRPAQSLDWLAFEDNLYDAMFESVQDSGAPLFDAVLGIPYPVGTRRIASLWLSSGQDAIDALYDAPSVSVLDWEEGNLGGATIRQALDCFPTTGPAGYVGVDHDSLGVAGQFALGVLAGLGALSAWSQALSWRADSMVVFQGPTPSDVALSWRIRFEYDSAAATASAMFDTGSGSVGVVQAERDLVVLAASSPSVLVDWTDPGCGSADDLPAPAEPTSAPAAIIRRLALARGN